MKVRSARYVLSAIKPDQYPREGFPEVAFVGRSNVGKSSLMNRLLGRRNLAKTSSTPGKTQTINFFLINDTIHFVDLPGYGFAKVPLKVKEEWGRVMSAYLAKRDPLCLVVMLIDARHKPSDHDAEMLGLLEDAQVPTLIAATKVDKLKRNERKKNLSRIRETLALDNEAEIIPVSSKTGEGTAPLWSIIDELILDR